MHNEDTRGRDLRKILTLVKDFFKHITNNQTLLDPHKEICCIVVR